MIIDWNARRWGQSDVGMLAPVFEWPLFGTHASTTLTPELINQGRIVNFEPDLEFSVSGGINGGSGSHL